MDIIAPVLHGPKRSQVLDEVTVDDPGIGEVRVRMVAAGICHSCLSVEQGDYPDFPFPLILGDEGAGVVDMAGPGTSLDLGDHVILSWAPACGRCRWCAMARPALCSQASPFHMSDGTTRFHTVAGEDIQHFGPSTYSPYVVVDESMAVKVTREMPLDKAALIGCAVTTGVGAVLNAANVRPGESVVIFGCGGVGLNAVQGAALAGANPIVAVDINEAKLEPAARLGATGVVHAAPNDPVAQVISLTGGGADNVIVAVGSTSAMEQAIACLGPTGTCVLVGAAAPGERVDVDPGFLLGGERRLVGSKYGSSNPHMAFPHLVSLYLAGKLKLDDLITHRYSLSQINEASQDLAQGRSLRGMVIFDH